MGSAIAVKSSVYGFCEKNWINPNVKSKGELEVKVEGLTKLLSADNKKSLRSIESEKNATRDRIISIGLTIGGGVLTAIGICGVVAVQFGLSALLAIGALPTALVMLAVLCTASLGVALFFVNAPDCSKKPTVDVLQMTNKIGDFSAAIKALEGKDKDAFVTIKPEADPQK